MNALVPLATARLPAAYSPAPDLDLARGFQRASKSPATLRAYRADWRAFTLWCQERGLQPLPTSTEAVCGHLAWCAAKPLPPGSYGPLEAPLSVSSIARRVAAIRYAHRLAGFEPPTGSEEVKATLAGIRRALAAPLRQKQPLTAPMIGRMLKRCPDTLIGKRDRALIALGFAGAFRRSELCALQVGDLTEVPDGLRVRIRRSKTDQEGRGQEIAIPRGYRLRPVEAVQTWLEAARITSGPVFREVGIGDRVMARPLSGNAIAVVVKTAAERAGFDTTEISAHSLRSGFLTSAAESGASIFKMMDQSRHRSMDTLRGYVRSADLFREHAGSTFL